MRKKTLLFVLFIIAAFNLNSMAQWELSSNMEGGNYNNIVHRDSLVFASSNNGVFRSSDGGDTWERSVNGLYLALDSTIEIDYLILTKKCLLASRNNSMAISNDSARSWKKFTLPAKFNDASLSEVKEGICALLNNGETMQFFISDDGIEWKEGSPVKVFDYNAQGVFNGNTYFINYDSIITTTGNLNFNAPVFTTGLPHSIGESYDYQLMILGQDNSYIYGSVFDNKKDSIMLYRLDVENRTWEPLFNNKYFSAHYTNFYFYPLGNNLVMVKDIRLVNIEYYISGDHGTTWNDFHPVGLAEDRTKPFISFDDTTYLTNGKEGIVKSTDNGDTWGNSFKGFYSKRTSVGNTNGIITRKFASGEKEYLNQAGEWQIVNGWAKNISYGEVHVNGKLLAYNPKDSSFSRSLDNGISFDKIPYTLPDKYYDIVLSSSGESVIAQAFHSTVPMEGWSAINFFLSKDDGNTWTDITDKCPFKNGTIYGGHGNFYFSESVYSADSNYVRIYKLSGSESNIEWLDITESRPFPGKNLDIYSLNVVTSDFLIVNLHDYSKPYKGYSYGDYWGDAFFRYDGNSWSSLEVPLPEGVHLRKVLMADDQYFITTNEKLYKWDLNNNSVTSISGNLETGLSIFSIAIGPERIYLGTEGGLYSAPKTVTSTFTDIIKKQSFQIYPNPSSSNSKVQLSGLDDFPIEIRIINLLGETMLRQRIEYGDENIEIKDLSSGLYKVVGTSSRGTHSQSLLIK